MASHTARVASCTERAAEAALAEGLTVLRQAGEGDASGASWVLADNAADAATDGKLLHGATSYLSMLHDSERNIAYQAGLQSLAEEAAAEGKEAGGLVLDLGAGTGLLAMLACKALPQSRAVACEVYGPMAELARQLVQVNGLTSRLKIIHKLASDLEVGADLPERADVCVFELFDSQLLGESIFPILRDAQERLLKPGARMVPRSVQLHAMLVQCCPALAAGDLPELRGAPWPVMLGQLGDSVVRPLSAPWKSAHICFASLPTAAPQLEVNEVVATASGTVHGVAWWWDLDMGGDTHLTNWCPAGLPDGQQPARHHWRPCISFVAPREITEGATLAVAQVHDDNAVWFAWHRSGEVPPRWIEGITTIPAERERLVLARSDAWIAYMRSVTIAAAEASKNSGEVLVVPAEDGLTMPLVTEALRSSGAAFAVRLPDRAARRLKRDRLLDDDIRCIAPAADVRDQRFTSVLLEPFITGLTCPWAHITGCRNLLQQVSSGLSAPAKFFPHAASIVAVAIECQSVWLARQPLEKICELDMRAANERLVPSVASPLECHLCELAWRPLSDTSKVVEVQFSSSGPWRGSCTFTPIANGACHGIAIWTEFGLAGTSLSTGPLPTGNAPTGWMQALSLLETPISFSVSEGSATRTCTLEVELACNGDLKLDIKDPDGVKRRRM